jgi:hypothetical protein
MRPLGFLTLTAMLGLPLVATANPYYLVATTITGANTKIDDSASTVWSFNVSQDFDLGGGALVMKDGPQTSEHLYLTLFDYTNPSLTPSAPGPIGETSCALWDAAAQECVTNQQFHDEVDTSGSGANNDQGYVPHYLFFGVTDYSATNVVSTATPFHLLAGHTYGLQLTSSEPSNSAYFIKGSPTTSSWGFVTDPSCTLDSSCTSDLPPTFIDGTVGAADTAAPEPGTWFSMLIGASSFIAVRRRRATR